MLEVLGRIAFGLFGMACLVGVTALCSQQRRAIDWRLVLIGLAMQMMLVILLLQVPGPREVLALLARGFVVLLGFVSVGTELLFGEFADTSKYGFNFVMNVLTTVIFFASLSAVMYHLGVMQRVVRGMSWVITRFVRLSGAETMSVCANVFVSQTEAPLVIKPFLGAMTRSEFFTVMVGGMATISGGMMAAYVGLLGGEDVIARQYFATHLLTASLMAVPATFVIAKILVPERETPLTGAEVHVEIERTTANVVDAAATGAADGLKLALNIGAMLLAFVSLIALMNAPLQWLGELAWSGGSSINAWLSEVCGRPTELSMQTVLGWPMAPVAWLIGVPWEDAGLVGRFIGEKIVVNEFVAYLDLSDNLGALQERSRLISTYALCGFANFSSIAIQIGGLGGIAPERRHDVARLGLRAVFGGAVVTLLTATIAGVVAEF